MTDQIGSTGPLSPQDKHEYEREYKEGVALFKQTLSDYPSAKSMFQKEEFKGVMQNAMQILNDAASGLRRQELLDQNKKIAKDLAAFQQQDTPGALDQLSSDLDKAKKKLG